jgi:hypothetical protein
MATIAMPDMNYNDSLILEKELSACYEWEDPESTIQTKLKNHSIQFNLTGDPRKLSEEYKRTNK